VAGIAKMLEDGQGIGAMAGGFGARISWGVHGTREFYRNSSGF
jgi:hypothetical protein